MSGMPLFGISGRSRFNAAKDRWRYLFSLTLAATCVWVTLASVPTKAKRAGTDTTRITAHQVLQGALRLPFVPEYDRSMDRVLLAVERNGLAEDMAAKLGILQALPAYSEVLLLRDEALNGAPLWKRLGVEGAPEVPSLKLLENRARWFDPESGTAWMQDLGEGAGGVMFLGVKGREHRESLLRLGVRAIEHPLPLDGGNVSLARNRSGQKIVFIGEREFQNARKALVKDGVSANDDLVRDAYRLTFSADRVVVMPTMGVDHVDQTVLFLGDGRAVTERLPELSEPEVALVDDYERTLAQAPAGENMEYVDAFDEHYRGDTAEVVSRTHAGVRQVIARNPQLLLPNSVAARYKLNRSRRPDFQDLVYTREFEALRIETEKRLRDCDFEILHLETSIRARLNRQYYVNAMPFRDRATGKPTLLLPVYGTAGQSAPMSAEVSQSGLNQRNIARLEQMGYVVKTVPGQYLRGGSTHCSIYQF